jgi:hypothetical protein
MNKTILLISSLLAGICLYGQTSKNGLVIRLDGNYNETATDNRLQYVNQYNAKSKNGNFLLSAGYKYGNWLWGLGFEYARNKTETNGQLFEYLRISEMEIRTFAFAEQSTVTLNTYGGTFYVSRYLPIGRNLYFTPGFYLGYGKIKGDYSGTSMSAIPYSTSSASDLSTSTVGSVDIVNYERPVSVPYFYMQLSPELTWFFSNRFGLNLQMGGLGISVVDFKWKESTKQINFNLSLWKLGILFKI